MYEELYNKFSNRIKETKYGKKLIIVINKLSTSLVYIIYPVVLTSLGINGDGRFWKVLIIPAIPFFLLSVFRNYFNASRPYELYNIQPIIYINTGGKSFPSRHVFSAFIIAMTIYYISNSLSILLFSLGTIIAIVRVLGGIHFPKDVIAGAIIGWKINIF